MNSHELALKLLALPDKPFIVTKPCLSKATVATGDKDNGYTADYTINEPWEDLQGSVRVQISQETDNVQAG